MGTKTEHGIQAWPKKCWVEWDLMYSWLFAKVQCLSCWRQIGGLHHLEVLFSLRGWIISLNVMGFTLSVLDVTTATDLNLQPGAGWCNPLTSFCCSAQSRNLPVLFHRTWLCSLKYHSMCNVHISECGSHWTGLQWKSSSGQLFPIYSHVTSSALSAEY